MVRPLLLLLCLNCLVIISNAQPSYNIQHFTTENGLPSNGMKGLVFDHTTGFLWIATEAGLIRFDGKNFVSFDKKGYSKLNERMAFIVQNRQGEIFAGGGQTRTIYKINKNIPSWYDNTRMVNPYFTTIFALCVSEKLYRDKVNPNPDFSISLIMDYSKVLPLSDTSCLITKDKLVLYYSLGMKDPKIILKDEGNIETAFSADGHFFVVTAKRKLLEWDNSANLLKEVQTNFSYPITDILLWQPGMNEPVLVSGKNAFLLRYKSGKFYPELICSEIPLNLNLKFAQYNTALKTLFLVTASNGFFMIREHTLAYPKKSPLDLSRTKAFYTQVLMPGNTILTNDGQQFGPMAYQKAPVITGSFSRESYIDKDSVLWYSQSVDTVRAMEKRRLFSYNYSTRKTTCYTKTRLVGEPFIQKCNNNIYVATTQGLFRLDGDSLVSVDHRFENNASFTPSAMREIKPGTLAIATCNTLFTYTISSRKTDTLLTTPTACIRHIFTYNGYLLIGTYGDGIYISKDGITRSIPLDKNEYMRFAHCFMPDTTGFCWISTNRGLFKVAFNDLIAAYTTQPNMVYYYYFGKADGMGNTEMNGACSPCAITLPDNTLSFPTMSGLLRVDPVKAATPLLWNDMFIDELRLNDSLVSPDSLPAIEFPSYTHTFLLRVATPLWNKQENNYVKYRLDNQEKWIWINDENTIQFLTLSPGKHTIQILKLDGFGTNNKSLLNISFTIKPYWYTTWWFISLIALLSIGLIYLIVTIRTRQIKAAKRKLELLVEVKTTELKEQNLKLEKKEAIQNRLISIINHDIITPLKFLSSTAHKLLEKKHVIHEDIRNETIYEMEQTSKSLQLLAGDILNWIKFQNEGKKLRKEVFSLHQLTDTVLHILEPIARQKGIELKSDISPVIDVYQYLDPMKVLVYNLVINAINFSDEGPINVTASASMKGVVLRIADKGMGMPAEQVKDLLTDKPLYQVAVASTVKGKGFGLGYLIIRDIIQITGIRIQIYSMIGKGTTIELFIGITPESNLHLKQDPA